MIPPTVATIGNGVLSSLMAAGDSYSDISDFSYSDYSYFDYSDYFSRDPNNGVPSRFPTRGGGLQDKAVWQYTCRRMCVRV